MNYRLVTASLLILAGCTEPESKDQSDQIYRECLDLYTEYVLPNSMARKKGFDINTHLKQIRIRRERLVKHFAGQDGQVYLIKQKHSTQDELEIGFINWALKYLAKEAAN